MENEGEMRLKSGMGSSKEIREKEYERENRPGKGKTLLRKRGERREEKRGKGTKFIRSPRERQRRKEELS